MQSQQSAQTTGDSIHVVDQQYPASYLQSEYNMWMTFRLLTDIIKIFKIAIYITKQRVYTIYRCIRAA